MGVPIKYSSGELLSVAVNVLRKTIRDAPESVIRELAAFKLSPPTSSVSQEDLNKTIEEAQKSGYLL